MVKAQPVRHLADPGVDRGLVGAAAAHQREGHILRHGEVRVQRAVLENHGDIALLRRHVVGQLPAQPERLFVAVPKREGWSRS
jgi:hypothetical protein